MINVTLTQYQAHIVKMALEMFEESKLKYVRTAGDYSIPGHISPAAFGYKEISRCKAEAETAKGIYQAIRRAEVEAKG